MSQTLFTPSPADAAQASACRLADFLRGYARHDPQQLYRLMAFEAWPQAARAVLAARCTRILDMQDDETLMLIASGAVSVPAVAAGVATEKGPL